MIRLEHTFAERVPLKSRLGKRIWEAPFTRRFPKRFAIRVHLDRYTVDQSTHYHGSDTIHVTWISLRHLYNSRGYTLKHRVRSRVRRVLWGSQRMSLLALLARIALTLTGLAVIGYGLWQIAAGVK